MTGLQTMKRTKSPCGVNMTLGKLSKRAIQELLTRAYDRSANTVYGSAGWSRQSAITWKVYTEWSRRK